jgi:hypothetical protein
MQRQEVSRDSQPGWAEGYSALSRMPVQEEGLDEVNPNALLAAMLIIQRHYLLTWQEINSFSAHQLGFMLEQIERYDRQ